MRPPNQPARDQMPAVLARRGPISATALAAELGISVATLHRLLPALGDQLVISGAARRTRYALRRALRGVAADLPLYAVDEAGQARHVGDLALLRPEGSHLTHTAADALGNAPGDEPVKVPGRTSDNQPCWPVPDESRDGWWGGLPYPLYDMRPQGYLGRQFARADHAALGLPVNPEAWSDDDIVWALTQRGADLSGHLILGNPAFERWQAGKLTPPMPIAEADIPAAYAALAEQAVARGVPGSSAAGEFPKFPALRELPGAATPHVLVKFSGADGSPAVQRWADLLVCEHHALRAAATLPGLTSAVSRIVQHAGGRTFLEVERFDRHGVFGRSALVSLGALDGALLGDGSSGSNNWPRLAARLAALELLTPQDVTAIELLWWFGRLIANSDMHAGNLSFCPRAGRLQLAPTYDMLPMAYAPLPGGEVAPRDDVPPLPLPPERAGWNTACAAATRFWHAAAGDPRVSAGFRALCAHNAQRLLETAQRL